MTAPILVVAGEPSGDAAAARVVRRLDVATFGMGGVALAAAGTDLLIRSDRTAALGITEVWGKLPRLLSARRELVRGARRRGPKRALLVNYSEFNSSLLSPLAAEGATTIFYGPPQVWAWRPERAKRIAAEVGHVAAVLPLEVEVWQQAGARVSYVGHPALDAPIATRPEALSKLELTRSLPVAILPGSRTAEVRAHLETMLSALRTVGLRGEEARVFVAAGLPAETQRWVVATAEAFGVEPIFVNESSHLTGCLAAFDVAMVASGTASLEVALSGVVPIIAYKTSPLTSAIARRLLRVSQVGLPNIVLGRAVFPELLQEHFTSENLARTLESELDGLHSPTSRRKEAFEELTSSVAVKNRPCEAVAALLSAA